MPARASQVALAAAIAAAVFYDGGFSPASRLVFAGLAALALIGAVATEGAAVARFARQPVVVALWALAVLGAASAAWTEGFAGDAIRWGLVTAGYGAVVVSAAVTMRRRHALTAIAAAICVAAAASGVVGLVGVALRTGPVADRIGGVWRPGGTLEYSAALALLEVSALPILLSAICSRSRRAMVAGSIGAAIAAAVLALAGSRTGLALAAAVCAAAILAPGRTVRAPRAQAALAVLALAATGFAVHLVAGGYAPPPGAHGAAHARHHRLPARVRRGIEPSSGFDHGRLDAWRAAVETFEDHPLRGAGADAFLAASARHQRHGPVRFAHDLPLELAAELGVAGAILAVALYATSAAVIWGARSHPAAWLLGPAVAAFLLANLLDWPWHLAGSGAVWALALGGMVLRSAPVPPKGSRVEQSRPPNDRSVS